MKNQQHLKTQLPCHYPRDGHLSDYDKREKIYMILATNFNDIVEDCGGDLSKTKLCLIERFVFLQQYLRLLEKKIIKCKKGKKKRMMMKRWSYACNSLLGLSRQIGLDKKHSKVVSIKSYAASKGKPA